MSATVTPTTGPTHSLLSVPHQLRGMASLPAQAGTGRLAWDGYDNAGPDVYWPVNHTRHIRTAAHR